MRCGVRGDQRSSLSARGLVNVIAPFGSSFPVVAAAAAATTTATRALLVLLRRPRRRLDRSIGASAAAACPPRCLAVAHGRKQRATGRRSHRHSGTAAATVHLRHRHDRVAAAAAVAALLLLHHLLHNRLVHPAAPTAAALARPVRAGVV